MTHFTAAFLWTFCLLMFGVHAGRLQDDLWQQRADKRSYCWQMFETEAVQYMAKFPDGVYHDIVVRTPEGKKCKFSTPDKETIICDFIREKP